MPQLIPAWIVLARKGARREAAFRRFIHRPSFPLIEGRGWGSFQRHRKREQHIDRDYHRLRLRSIIMSHKLGVTAEQWQDIYYGELEACGERAPPGVRQRWENEHA